MFASTDQFVKKRVNCSLSTLSFIFLALRACRGKSKMFSQSLFEWHFHRLLTANVSRTEHSYDICEMLQITKNTVQKLIRIFLFESVILHATLKKTSFLTNRIQNTVIPKTTAGLG